MAGESKKYTVNPSTSAVMPAGGAGGGEFSSVVKARKEHFARSIEKMDKVIKRKKKIGKERGFLPR